MLVNFCDACLRTDVTCSTVSTEGYEVDNLVNNSDKGFLAYSCIKPPIKIDFVFICNIQISHVILWPQIGAQKSCGFQLSVKSSDESNQPFTDVSSAFLKKEETGVLFYRRDISYHTEIPVPSNFSRRYIKASNVVNYVNSLRLCIIKTDNSVPALSKIEIWGTVSPKCGKDVVGNVSALWLNRFNHLSRSVISVVEVDASRKQEEERVKEQNNLLDVPDDFIDPITCEIMTQPVILPSGKIIDQKTLEKHAHNEAIWGRPASDPFTGIRFNEIHKPVSGISLKTRIDKFLLENSNLEEIKNMPRVLGTKNSQNSCKDVEIISCITENFGFKDNISKSSPNQLKRTLPSEKQCTNNIKKAFHGHILPEVCLRSSRAVSKNCNTNRQNSAPVINKSLSTDEIDQQNNAIQKRLFSNVQVTVNPLTCKCCTNSVLYKLPCEHIICRKALLLLEKNQCSICKLEFETKDPQRFHLAS